MPVVSEFSSRMGERDEIDSVADTEPAWPAESLLSAVGTLPAAQSRPAVERILCDRLVQFDCCRAVWVGERTGADGAEIRLRTSSDPTGTSLDTAAETTLDVPVAAETLRTGAVESAAVEDERFGPRRELAAASGIASVVTVPLCHDGVRHGVLCCYSDRPVPLPERARAALASLGATTGSVLTAVARKQLLFAERTVELRFRIRAPEFLPAALSDGLNSAVTMDGYLLTEAGRWLLYLTVRNGDLEAAGAVVKSVQSGARVRVIDRQRGRLEVDGPDLPAFDAIAAVGGTVSDCIADSGAVELSVTVPRGRERQTVVSAVRDQFPSCDCLAAFETDPVSTDARPETAVIDELTEKQYRALETAILAGYFDWPRGSTAEEVATRMGITSPTFHAHVRKAEHRILTTLLGL